VPITRFCDERQLSPRQRLELFIPVCQAIQHAHQKGIIHRDIKPTNVLVALYDDRPVPKVIDFGVAKAAGLQLTDATLMTGFGAIVGTPEYMSPEQAQLNQLDIDTRSDVYALGVLLYELLTGTTPIDRKRLGQGALFEVLRIIREEEPPRPSTRLSTSDALASIAATRATEPSKLAKLMRGELDWIVMKCLEKDRSRRYETANGLAHDLERYLADEPVEACPPSSTYRLRKLAGKYKRSLATAAAFVLLLVAGVVTSTLLAVWATTAEREANRQRIASRVAEQAALDAKADADKQRDQLSLAAYASGMQLAQRAWNENDVVRARELLEELPKEAAARKLRGFEWHYLDRLCHSELQTLKGHAARLIHSLAFSPDGQRLASGCYDGTVKVWDGSTGKELLSLEGHDAPITCVAFRIDGQRLATGGFDKTVRIWDSMTGKKLLSLEGHAETIWSAAFSPDGQRLASGSQDTTVRIWDCATGKELLSLRGHSGSVESLAFSPDGKRLASATNQGEERIWDTATGKQLSAHKAQFCSRLRVAFGPDGRRLASAHSGDSVMIWDDYLPADRPELKDTGWPLDLAFSRDGRRLASTDEKVVKIWDIESGGKPISLKGHAAQVWSLAFSPDGDRLASGSLDGAIKLWEVTEKEVFSLGSPPGYGESWQVTGDQRMPFESYNKVVNIWDPASGEELEFVKYHSHWVTGLASSPDGQRLASGSMDGTVRIRDAATDRELFSLKGHGGPVSCVTFSRDGKRLASSSMDGTVKIWDIAIGRVQFTLSGRAGPAYYAAFDPDSRSLASGNMNGSVKIWDCSTGKELFSLTGHVAPVTRVAFSPDGLRLASGSDDNTVKIWNSATGKELFSLKGHTGFVTSLAFSPDGQRLASGSRDHTVKIWDSSTGREVFTIKSEGSVTCVEFSPDGEHLAATCADLGSTSLWDASITPELRQRRGVSQRVMGLFREIGLRADVVQRLQTMPGMSPSGRQEAIGAALRCPENPWLLDALALELVKRPGGESSGYRKALRYCDVACQIDSNNGRLLNTLGMAHYRVGNFEKSLAALLRSDEIKTPHAEGSIPANLAFLAMTQQQLGHAKEAQAELERLRERLKEPRWSEDDEVQGFLHEAEALLAKPKTPGGK
jgi:eukaryotic-like serine/threonine-protein kinase